MADPLPHGLIVAPLAASHRRTSADFPCCVIGHSHACRHHYPGGTDGDGSLCLHPQRPSPLLWRVGFHDNFSGPARCSLHVTACTVRWPAFHGPFLVVLQIICHLLNRSQCFGLERCRPPGFEPGIQRRLFQGVHNNLIENAIRPTAIGKKNWLFIGQAEAGERSAILYTIIENCRRRGIDPFGYLKAVFTRLPSMTNWQIKDITPKAWDRRQSNGTLRAAA